MKKVLASRPKTLKTKIRPVKRVAISDEIVEQIMNLIANGDLQPGQRLPSERELCKTFHAGRSSLREALRCLSIVGVLNARVGEGTSVAPDGGRFMGKLLEWRLITEQHDVENLFETRVALEALAASNVARLRSKEVLTHLQDILSKMEAVTGDPKRFAALDLDFHVTLGRASENSLLFDLISMIRSQLIRAISKVLSAPQALPLTLKEHASIIGAIRRGDSEGAREAMQGHLYGALERYRKSLPEKASTPAALDEPSAKRTIRRVAAAPRTSAAKVLAKGSKRTRLARSL